MLQADTLSTTKSMILRAFLSNVWAKGVLVLANLEKKFEERMIDHTCCSIIQRKDYLAPKLFYWYYFGKKTMFTPVSNPYLEKAIMFVPAHNYEHTLFHSAVASLSINTCKSVHTTTQELKSLKVVVGFVGGGLLCLVGSEKVVFYHENVTVALAVANLVPNLPPHHHPYPLLSIPPSMAKPYSSLSSLHSCWWGLQYAIALSVVVWVIINYELD